MSSDGWNTWLNHQWLEHAARGAGGLAGSGAPIARKAAAWSTTGDWSKPAESPANRLDLDRAAPFDSA